MKTSRDLKFSFEITLHRNFVLISTKRIKFVFLPWTYSTAFENLEKLEILTYASFSFHQRKRIKYVCLNANVYEY